MIDQLPIGVEQIAGRFRQSAGLGIEDDRFGPAGSLAAQGAQLRKIIDAPAGRGSGSIKHLHAPAANQAVVPAIIIVELKADHRAHRRSAKIARACRLTSASTQPPPSVPAWEPSSKTSIAAPGFCGVEPRVSTRRQQATRRPLWAARDQWIEELTHIRLRATRNRELPSTSPTRHNIVQVRQAMHSTGPTSLSG